MNRIKQFFVTVGLLTLISCSAHRAALRHSIADRPTVQPTGSFVFPLKGARILSPFGKRSGTFHMGIDLQKSRRDGDSVFAARSGKVTSAKWARGYGYIISIYHPDGYVSRYAHLKAFKVKVGQQVKTNQTIGVVGHTGRASTPHLHFEIITPDGKFIDPLTFLPR